MINYLNIIDLIVLSFILFGPALYSSLKATKSELCDFNDVCEFSSKENISAFIMQFVQLFLAIIYLRFRGIEPFCFKFDISLIATIHALLLFFVFGFCMDVITSLKCGFKWIPKLLKNNIPILSALQDIDFTIVLISILNGFYEEFFFLAILSYVEPKYTVIALIIMLIVRVLIHTYQGWSVALFIGLGIGLIHYLLFAHYCDNLFIYVLSHILSDLFGLSFINLI